jgi:peroxiredoxin/DNA-binding transcriptional MerR regulator
VNSGRAAAEAGLTARALRYYESICLVVPARRSNGYRDYRPDDVRLLQEVKALTDLGLSVEQTRPFLECLSAGHTHADDCPASLAVYRTAISLLDARIASLADRRGALLARLNRSAERGFHARTRKEATLADLTQLPDDLPAPADDGAAAHLPGAALSSLCLPATDGVRVCLDELGTRRSVLYFYPLTGKPGVDLPEGWDAIPGARGCTAEACDFRDHYDELRAAGVDAVYGVSSQTTDYQRDLVDRLSLPFPMLSDPQLTVARTLNVPTFTASDQHLYRRLTLVIANGRIEHVFYPVFPPNEHARQLVTWLARPG